MELQIKIHFIVKITVMVNSENVDYLDLNNVTYTCMKTITSMTCNIFEIN